MRREGVIVGRYIDETATQTHPSGRLGGGRETDRDGWMNMDDGWIGWMGDGREKERGKE